MPLVHLCPAPMSMINLNGAPNNPSPSSTTIPAARSAAVDPAPSPMHTILTNRQTPASPPLTGEMWTWSQPVHTDAAPPSHTSVWSVTCDSTPRTLADQCLEHPNTPTTSAATAFTALVHQATPLAY
ncbi:hypothetical protein SprV_0100119500 [Sparganum proliferum]